MGENAQCRHWSATRRAARSEAGFTVIELLVAVALGLVVLAGLFRTFKVQHDSYIIQDQVSAMQQNLRAAMHFITRDLQMAGYYTNFDRNNKQMDWNDLDGDSNPTTNMETGRPLIFAVNDSSVAGDDIKDNTDVIVIVKASTEDGRLLASGESASAGSLTLNLPNFGLNSGTKKYGVLIKNDLSFAELFHLDNSGNITPPLTETYTPDLATPSLSDRIHRADIIIYRVEDSTPARPCLVRKNLGSDNGYQVIAENIDNLQFRYQLNDGTWVHDPAGNQARVRAVEILLVARTAYPQRGYKDTNSITFGGASIPAPNDSYRRKIISSIVKTRNIGL